MPTSFSDVGGEENMSKEAKVNREEIKPMVSEIIEKTAELRAIVESMKDCTIKTYYMNSVVNLEKKNDLYYATKERLVLTPAERERVLQMRAEAQNAEPTPEQVQEVDQSSKSGRKKKNN